MPKGICPTLCTFTLCKCLATWVDALRRLSVASIANTLEAEVADVNDEFLNIKEISFDSPNRSGRWADLRKYLKLATQSVDMRNDKLAEIQQEIESVRNDNLRLAEVLQMLCDAANEEVQRETSLMLNDMDYDVVIDEPQDPSFNDSSNNDIAHTMTLEDFIDQLKKLPGVGGARAETIGEYISKAGADSVFEFANILFDINEKIAESEDSAQPTLPLD